MKRSFITAALAAIISASAAQAQTPDTAAAAPATVLSLEECLDMTVRNNRAAVIAANNVGAAVQTRREAFTKYFPEVSAAGAWFRTHKDVFQYNVLDLFTIGLIDRGTMASVQAMQPVFLGGRVVNGNRLAKVGEEAAKLKESVTIDDLRLSTEQYYWNLTTLIATRATVESAIAMLDTLSRQVSVAVDAGVAMKNDLLKVDLKRNSFRADLVDVDNGISLVKMLLAQAMGTDTASVVIAADVPVSTPPFPSDLYQEASVALPATNDFRLLEKNVEAKRLEKRMELGNYLPSVAVGAGWFYHNLLRQNTNFGALMVGVTVPISGWWGGSHALKRKQIELDNAREELTDLSQKLEIEMQDKWDNLTAAHRKMAIASEAIGQAAENLRLNRVYYEAGMSTITDLLDAETSHTEALTAYITAYGAFRVARAAYLDATGR